MTEFIEGFREKYANDFTVLTDPNNMGLKEGNQYELVVGRHPNEREVRGMKAGFQKPKFRKMSERDFVDKIAGTLTAGYVFWWTGFQGGL